MARLRKVFSDRLALYRGRFDHLLGACNCKSGRAACELMRRRLEELADFLQQLLDSKGGDVTLNTSQLSMDLREGLQRSIKESRMLSCSVLEEQEQASLLEEMGIGHRGAGGGRGRGARGVDSARAGPGGGWAGGAGGPGEAADCHTGQTGGHRE